MTKADSLRLLRPTTDERRLWDIIGGVLGGQGFLVALDLKLFPWLAERPATIEEVAGQFRLDRRAAGTLLISSISMLLWSEGIQRSGPEHIDILSSVGFTEAEITPTFGDWSIVSARKT